MRGSEHLGGRGDLVHRRGDRRPHVHLVRRVASSSGKSSIRSASTLVAPQEGLGYFRQSPDFRKLMNLAQAALDPADPINFAKLFLLAPPLDMNGNPMPPRPVLDVHTVGDFLVPTATGMAFSRAAGLLPFLSPTAGDTMPDYAGLGDASGLCGTRGAAGRPIR